MSRPSSAPRRSPAIRRFHRAQSLHCHRLSHAARGRMTLLLDPRKGDIEDDTSSTKGRSLLSLAGTLLVEISLPKLVAAWLLLVAVPCILLGLAPLVGSAWLTTFSRTAGSTYGGLLTFALVLIVLAIGWFGGRTIFRIA